MNKNLKVITVLISLILYGCSSNTKNIDFLPQSIPVVDSPSTLYVTNIPSLFDTLTIYITKDGNNKKDKDIVKYFKNIAKHIGNNNLATQVNYGFGNTRYKKIMKYVNNCSDINPHNIPLILFYIKKTDSCYKFNYGNYEEFQSIMDLLAQELEKASINSSNITKFKIKQIIHDEAITMNISKNIIDVLDLLIDNIYKFIQEQKS